MCLNFPTYIILPSLHSLSHLDFEGIALSLEAGPPMVPRHALRYRSDGSVHIDSARRATHTRRPPIRCELGHRLRGAPAFRA